MSQWSGGVVFDGRCAVQSCDRKDRFTCWQVPERDVNDTMLVGSEHQHVRAVACRCNLEAPGCTRSPVCVCLSGLL